jgi:hypothetical protein
MIFNVVHQIDLFDKLRVCRMIYELPTLLLTTELVSILLSH